MTDTLTLRAETGLADGMNGVFIFRLSRRFGGFQRLFLRPARAPLLPASTRGPLFLWDGWSFEPAEWRLLNAASEPVQLPNKTLDLLALLLERAPALVGKDEILSTVWGDAIVEEGNIAFHVGALRKVLDRDASPSCIETVRGRGYRFVAELSRADQTAPARVAPPETSATPDAATPLPEPRRRVSIYAVLTVIAIVSGLTWWAATSPTTVVKTAPTHSEASALVLEGRNLWRLRTPPDVQQAIRVLERAIAVDDNYAPAYAALADAYNITMSGLPAATRHERAKAYAERAVALQPDLADGHASLAFLRYKFEWRWAESEREFQRAISLNPNYALAHHWYGEFLGLLGRYDESIREFNTALALDPESLAIQSDLVMPLLDSGRIAEARQIIEAAAKTNPSWHWIPYRMARVLEVEGREREGLEEWWRWMLLTGATFETVDAQRRAYRDGGLPAMLRVEVAQLLAAEPVTPGTATKLARAYARLGDRQETLRWIATALDRREDAAFVLLTNTDYDFLRGDPEFDRMLRRIGLKPLQRR